MNYLLNKGGELLQDKRTESLLNSCKIRIALVASMHSIGHRRSIVSQPPLDVRRIIQVDAMLGDLEDFPPLQGHQFAAAIELTAILPLGQTLVQQLLPTILPELPPVAEDVAQLPAQGSQHDGVAVQLDGFFEKTQ